MRVSNGGAYLQITSLLISNCAAQWSEEKEKKHQAVYAYRAPLEKFEVEIYGTHTALSNLYKNAEPDSC